MKKNEYTFVVDFAFFISEILLFDIQYKRKPPRTSFCCFYACMKLLFHCFLNRYGYGYCCANHWVVAHTEEPHHLDMSRNR